MFYVRLEVVDDPCLEFGAKISEAQVASSEKEARRTTVLESKHNETFCTSPSI